MMPNIEPKQNDINAIKQAMWNVVRSKGVDAMIDEYSKALAYQNALNRVTIEIYKDIITEFGKHNKKA